MLWCAIAGFARAPVADYDKLLHFKTMATCTVAGYGKVAEHHVSNDGLNPLVTESALVRHPGMCKGALSQSVLSCSIARSGYMHCQGK